MPQQARGQYAYGTSAIGYDDNTKEVFGYSSTELDYYAGYYYDPYVEGFMYDQYNYNPISSGYNRGFAYYWPAEVGTYHWPGQPNTEYDVISDHYVIAAWSTSVTICDDYYYSGCTADYWYDAWGTASSAAATSARLGGGGATGMAATCPSGLTSSARPASTSSRRSPSPVVT
jgi:hypothetical protein